MFGFQVGGGNGNGAFGSGIIGINGPTVSFNIRDSGPAGGSASHGIASWNASFNYGRSRGEQFRSIFVRRGQSEVPLAQAGVAALRIHISDTGGVFRVGGVDLGQMVLADSLVNLNNVFFVALGGSGAAMLMDAFGNFRGLAIDNVGALPANDNILATATLTIYADPMSLDGYDPTFDTSLISATGTTLPTSGISAVPEPTAPLLAAFGGLILMLLKKSRRVVA